jgi:tetratricopeptide (TPR) repeat protein
LGRIYYDLGCQCQRKQEGNQFFHKAYLYFDQSYRINLKWGDEHNRAFDLFRKAQVQQMEHNWRDARALRSQARQTFGDGSVGGSMALLHIELEEAKILLEEGEINTPKSKAEEVLRGWAQFKYVKGVGDSLKMLGELEYIQGNLASALEIFATRLCVYPYDHYPSSLQVWEQVQDLRLEIMRREGRKFYQQMLQRLHESAEHRQGHFIHLNQITVDRNADIARILSKLGI